MSYARAASGSEYDLSSVPSHVFYQVATRLGTAVAIEIWRDALKAMTATPTIPDFAKATVDRTQKRSGDDVAQVVKGFWRLRGVHL